MRTVEDIFDDIVVEIRHTLDWAITPELMTESARRVYEPILKSYEQELDDMVEFESLRRNFGPSNEGPAIKSLWQLDEKIDIIRDLTRDHRVY